MEEIALVSDQGIVAKLLFHRRGHSVGLVLVEQRDQALLAAFQVGLLALEQSVAQRAEAHQPEEGQPCEGDQQVKQHQLDSDGERSHGHQAATNM
jgi:hypothetical protein